MDGKKEEVDYNHNSNVVEKQEEKQQQQQQQQQQGSRIEGDTIYPSSSQEAKSSNQEK